MDPAGESLISRLELSDCAGVHALFASHLSPFFPFISDNPIPQKPLKKKSADDHRSLIRSLAKQHLSFLNRALSALQKRLSRPPESQSQREALAHELFDTYSLCLRCLECVSSQLDCKPHTVPAFRVWMIHCFEKWGRYQHAEAEGFAVLQSLKRVAIGDSKAALRPGRQYLPCCTAGADQEFASLVVEVVVTLVKCVSMRQRKDGEVYCKVLDVVDEAKSWFRVLDAKTYEKLHRLLLSCLHRTTVFLVGELQSFDTDLVLRMCSATLKQYAMSSAEDEMLKFACRLCSCLFSQQENVHGRTIDVLLCILDSAAHICKVAVEAEYIELVSYCATRCVAKMKDQCKTVAVHLIKLSVDIFQGLEPFGMILRLYASGLYLVSSNFVSRGMTLTNESLNDNATNLILPNKRDIFEEISVLIEALRSYFHISSPENMVSLSSKCADSVGPACSPTDSNRKASASCTEMNEKEYIFCYMRALAFLCQPLSELVTSEKRRIVALDDSFFSCARLCNIQGAFHQLCDMFLNWHRYKSEKERGGFDLSKTLLHVAVAVFTLSLRTKLNMQKSVDFIRHIVSSAWIQPQELKFLFASLYSIGITLYKNNQLEEASKALKLLFRESWNCVSLHCEMLVGMSKGIGSGWSEAAVVDFINDTCSKAAVVLDVLDHCGNCKLGKMIVSCLKSWLVAGQLCPSLERPAPLVKHWVKVNCKLHKDIDVDINIPTLYCLLSSCVEVSEISIAAILEQELQAYEEINRFSPKFCQRMQMRIIDILLKDVYVKKDAFLKKFEILIKKGKMLRAHGFQFLKDCFQCLSEAISIINDARGHTSEEDVSLCKRLAVAYCLRAFCKQEAEPTSELVFQDIQAALELWLVIYIPGDCFRRDQQELEFEYTMVLLYHLVDLLSLKGCTNFHHDIYKLLIRFSKWKNVPPENLVVFLWEHRRLNHGLCCSPVNEAFLENLSDIYGEYPKSMEFWENCMKVSYPLLLEFQQNMLLLSTAVSQGSCHESSFLSDVAISEARGAAFDLVSKFPASSHSLFLASFLYHGICEKLIRNGQFIKAVSYAKEAYHLRTKLLLEKFTYELQDEVSEEGTDSKKKRCFGLCNLQISSLVASGIWSSESSTLDSCSFTPWIVLQCYLESTLQVGIIYEVVGNDSAAEVLLVSGKNISLSLGLWHFYASFSSILGKLYRKREFLDLAEKEFYSAKNFLLDDTAANFCLKCRLVLEVKIDLELGDLCRSRHDSTTLSSSVRSLSLAENLYGSAMDKLNRSEWKNSISCPEEFPLEITLLGQVVAEEDRCVYCISLPCSETKNVKRFSSEDQVPQARLQTRKSKRLTKALKKDGLHEPGLATESNMRMTRSRYRACQAEGAANVTKATSGTHVSACPTTFADNETIPSDHRSSADFGSVEICICVKGRCWYCIPLEVARSGLISNFIHLKWEFIRRKLSLQLITNLGKCLGVRGEIHGMHGAFLRGLTLMFKRNAYKDVSPSESLASLLDMIGKDIPGDLFLVERAAILYNICWFSLKFYNSKSRRSNCCLLSHLELQQMVSLLMQAFTLCREVPLLFKKVSRLLVVIILYFASSETSSSLLFSCKALSQSHWASYFHQASLGNHLNYQLFSGTTTNHKVPSPTGSKGLKVAVSSSVGLEAKNLSWLVPESRKDLKKFVIRFFEGLPCTTVICLSLLGHAYCSLLSELKNCPSVDAWMLLSRISSTSQPIVVLLPVDPMVEEISDGDTATSSWPRKGKENLAQWRCPWVSSVVDDVAPAYKLILEENYLSSTMPQEDSKRSRSLWWNQRKELDQRLGRLLRDLEYSWFGPWKFLLLGELVECMDLDAVSKKLTHDLKQRYKMDASETVIKVLLGGNKSVFEEEGCISEVFLRKGCYIGDGRRQTFRTSTNASNGVHSLFDVAFKLIIEAADELEKEEQPCRQPVILVLDYEVQMLPWENMPILRNEEVYRMPSISSISATIDRYRQCVAEMSVSAVFPLIDPLDGFYLLNPSGDLCSTEEEFENWFRNYNLKGKAGSEPTTEELATALENHDLFIYFGHGSGAQYIPGHEIQKLEKCAATLLMGCSSGSLSLSGCYPPRGIPLYYLRAGSPVIVANLWEVTDKDIDRFAKAMLDAWMKERSILSTDCAQCDPVTELNSLNIRESGTYSHERTSKEKLMEPCHYNNCNNLCTRPKVGSFMGQAREACVLPFLIGASPVCYGVPTGICNKSS